MLYRSLSYKSQSYPLLQVDELVPFFNTVKVISSVDSKFYEKQFISIAAQVINDTATLEKLQKAAKKTDKQSILASPLERSQFIEILIRVAVEKFKDLKLGASESLKLILNDFLQERFSEEIVFQDIAFTEHEVHQGTVNDILYVNQKNMYLLYERFKNKETGKFD